MLAARSAGGRRLVCALDRGAELIETLRGLCDAHEVRTAEVRGAGLLEDAELSSYDPHSQMWLGARRVGGPLELLSLWGNVSEDSGATSIRVHATMARCAPAEEPGPTLGGQLSAARVFSVEVVLDCFDDLILRRHRDAATGLARWKEAIGLGAPAQLPDAPTETLERIDPALAAAQPPAPEPAPPRRPGQRYPTGSPMAAFEEPTPTGKIRLADPVLAPERPEPRPEDRDPALVIPGDLIDHPRLGRCVVDSLEGGGQLARLRLRSGRTVRLDLTAIRLRRRPGTSAPRIFDAEVTSR